MKNIIEFDIYFIIDDYLIDNTYRYFIIVDRGEIMFLINATDRKNNNMTVYFMFNISISIYFILHYQYSCYIFLGNQDFIVFIILIFTY